MVCPWTSPTSSGKLWKRPFHSRSSWHCQGPSWCLSSSNLQQARRDYFRNHGDLVHGYHKSSWLKQSNHRKPGPLPLAWLFTRYWREWGLHSPEWYLILCNGLQSLTTTQDIPSLYMRLKVGGSKDFLQPTLAHARFAYQWCMQCMKVSKLTWHSEFKMDGDSALPKTFLRILTPLCLSSPGVFCFFIIHFGMTKMPLCVNEFCSGFTNLLIFHKRVTPSSVMYDCTLCS